MKGRIFGLIGAWLLCSTAAFAQIPPTVTAASGVTFTASAEHSNVVGGVATVASYQLDVIAQNPLGALGFSFGLGKPTPDATNMITVRPIANFGALTNGTYTATVSAVGPGGTGKSATSALFVRVGPPAPPGVPTIVP